MKRRTTSMPGAAHISICVMVQSTRHLGNVGIRLDVLLENAVIQNRPAPAAAPWGQPLGDSA
ncbi:hypothetical protein KBY72_11995 [Cyanobium sp. BA5m-21]|uniref:hypothetical protein n=1 Tax=Cyanobium sp. BA5m-21 TaxID=2823706 RepID=UPI0020CEA669|nr:hypothetical protein [Cyanobium sp. BA5m-21]MCP9907888.1 hypothetical protein [Cyanobium sp. BA5m-21]